MNATPDLMHCGAAVFKSGKLKRPLGCAGFAMS